MFKIQQPANAGEHIAGPPTGWRPRALKIAEKLEIIINQNGKDTDTNERLLPLDEGVQFDHRPAIQMRKWDADAQDTIPPSCDLKFIAAINKSTHGKKTKKDVAAIAKIKRINKKAKGEQSKWKTKIPSRPFQKRSKQN